MLARYILNTHEVGAIITFVVRRLMQGARKLSSGSTPRCDCVIRVVELKTDPLMDWQS